MSGPALTDDTLIRRMRAAVAGELLARVGAEQQAGRHMERQDQEVLGRHLINTELQRHAQNCIARNVDAPSGLEWEVLARAVFDRLFNLGLLQPLLDDERITNITAYGYDQVFVEYADGTKVPGPPIAASDTELIEMFREYGRRYGLSEREFNPSRPSIEVPLPGGSRFFGMAWVCERPCLAIRRHRFLKVTLADEQGLGLIDHGLTGFLGASVRAGKQIMIAGPTGAGKTTLLRALASEIPAAERIITIETEKELGLDQFPDLHPDCIALEAREPNVEGTGAVTVADLVRKSLRMNPDRVLVGEVRGDEVIPMLNAMSQGNDGSMCTIHADSSGTVFNRIALYAMQAPERLPLEVAFQLAAEAIDLVVFIAKRRGQRFVSSIRQVAGAEERMVITNELYRPGPDRRAVPSSPIPSELLEELCDAGYDPTLHHNPDGWWDR